MVSLVIHHYAPSPPLWKQCEEYETDREFVLLLYKMDR